MRHVSFHNSANNLRWRVSISNPSSWRCFGALLRDVGTSSHVSPSSSFVLRSIWYLLGYAWLQYSVLRWSRSTTYFTLFGSSLDMFAFGALVACVAVVVFLFLSSKCVHPRQLRRPAFQAGHLSSIWSGLQRVRAQACEYDGFCPPILLLRHGHVCIAMPGGENRHCRNSTKTVGSISPPPHHNIWFY